MLSFSNQAEANAACQPGLPRLLGKAALGSLLIATSILPATRTFAAPANPTITVPAPLPTPVTQPVTMRSAADISNALTRYQMALDQLAQGQTTTARILLQDGIRIYGDQPELNLLLGYILQREGRAGEAQRWLTPVNYASPLATEYSRRLQTLARAEAPRSSAGNSALSAAVSRTSLEQTDARLEKLEQALVELVNAERKKNGLETLAVDSTLASVARAHSAEMRDLSYFAHESPTTALRTQVERYRAIFNTTPRTIAENIYRAWGRRHVPDGDDIKKAHESLMNSPSHRANILLGRVTRIGIGIVANENGDIWVTQMFSRV